MHDLKTAAKSSRAAKMAAMGAKDQTTEYPGSQSVKKPADPPKGSQTYDTQRIPTRATGGRIAGEAASSNLGQAPRASGKAKPKGTIVNVIVAPPAAAQPTPVPAPVPAGPPPSDPGLPDMGAKPPGGLPMLPGGGAPPPMPGPMAAGPMPARATGGRVKMTAGSRSGKGRMQKAHNAKMDREG